jgi:hypothetical protein
MSHGRLGTSEIEPCFYGPRVAWGGAKRATMWEPARKPGGLDSVLERAELA